MLQKAENPRKLEDHNKAMRLEAIRQLERLLHVLQDPTYRGHVNLEAHGKDGRVIKIRTAVSAWVPDP